MELEIIVQSEIRQTGVMHTESERKQKDMKVQGARKSGGGTRESWGENGIQGRVGER